MNNDHREILVRDFIRDHKGCNKQAVIEGLQDSISKKTVYKVIEMMKKEGQLEELNVGKSNKRCKLFLKFDNPLVYIPLELEEFEKSFFSLFIKAREKVGDSLRERAIQEFAKKHHWKIKKSTELLTTVERAQLLAYLLSIFYRLVDSFLFRSISVWPIQIQDKKVLNKIYEIFL
jgi:Fe2+ or Zn2+ uptake regulation protein